jgi:hypothetical protein
LDTGAAHSLVDRDLADRLHLAVTGTTARAIGVACTAAAGQVQVPNWSLGQVPLRPQTLVSLSMAGSPGGPTIAGLLGSDVWSRFGQFRLDYRAGRLMVPGPEQATAPTAAAAPTNRQVPMTVVHTGTGSLALVPVTLDGHDPMMFVLDTGSSTSVVDLNVVRRLSLPPVGHPRRATGVSCATTTQPIHVSSWQVGTVGLPRTEPGRHRAGHTQPERPAGLRRPVPVRHHHRRLCEWSPGARRLVPSYRHAPFPGPTDR